MFTPHLETLPAPQRRLWSELREIPTGFVLYGGTALALRLGHRASEDFDFFSNQGFPPDELERQIPFLAGAQRLQSSANTLVALVERDGPVKVSFFGGLSLRRVNDPEPVEGPGVLVASLLDLAATKVKVAQDRAEARDYLDIARLLEIGIDLSQALGAALAIYGETFNPVLSLKALCYFADGSLPSLPQDVRSRLTGAVRGIDPRNLPKLEARPEGISP
jgi:Nucleotidyl transferase AbiEii toxin, Type IV TA system